MKDYDERRRFEADEPLQPNEALPVRPDRRIAAIDVLRGAALFGVPTVRSVA